MLKVNLTKTIVYVMAFATIIMCIPIKTLARDVTMQEKQIVKNLTVEDERIAIIENIQPKAATYELGFYFTRSYQTSNLSRTNGAGLIVNASVTGNNAVLVGVFDAKTNEVIGVSKTLYPGGSVIGWSAADLTGHGTVYVYFSTLKNTTQYISGYISY